MKKILVILMILAVAGGVFAQQGSWSVGASTEIGARVNLIPEEYTDPDSGDPSTAALVRGVDYNMPYSSGWDGIYGTITLGYAREAINFGWTYHLFAGDAWNSDHRLRMNATAAGENYRFQIVSDINKALFAAQGGHGLFRMWGAYSLLDGMVDLEIAYLSRDGQKWASDTTGAMGGDYLTSGTIVNVNNEQSVENTGWIFRDAPTFAKFDGNNFLSANVDLQGLQFGVILPNIFTSAGYYGNGDARWSNSPAWMQGAKGNSNSLDGIRLVEDGLKKMIIGAMFTMSPVEVAAQFLLQDYGIYVGGRFELGPATFGLSFSGILGEEDNDPSHIKLGGRLDYSGDAFGAGIKAFYGRVTFDKSDTTTYNTLIGIEPTFFFNAIPSHLLFQLNAGFYFDTLYIGGEKEARTGNFANLVGGESELIWAVQPEFFWNFTGTGAASYWGIGTGMIFRYRVVSDAMNALDVLFKFSI